KWVFRNKKDERGIVIKNKVRLVAQGHTQEEGIGYDEVFAPVAQIEAIRLFLAYASFMGFLVYQMDAKSAFLYGTIKEEVYVCQPPGFEDPDYPNKVYKEVKSLYGLHQAPRAWYETLANYLLENGFQRGKIDQTLFIKKQKGDILLVQVYVDDIIFGSTNKELCKAFEKLMKDKFQMNVKSASTPIETEKPLLKDPDGEDTVVATSSTKADYVVAASCCAQVLWIQYQLLDYGKELVSPKQKALGKDISNSFMAGSLPKTKCKKMVVSEDVINRDLHLDDVDGVKCLPNEEIFTELARMGYEKPHPKLTFYKAFFSAQWKFLIHTLVQCLSAKRTAMVRNVDSPSKFLMYPRFLQFVMDNQVGDMTSHSTRYTSPALTQKVFANMRRVGKGFSGVETPLFASMLVPPQPQVEEEVEVPNAPAPPSPTTALSPPPQDPTPCYTSCFTTTGTTYLRRGRMHLNRGKIEAIDPDENITLVDVEKDEEVVTMDAKPQGRIDQEEVSAATNDVSAAEPTVFNDEEIAQKLHDEEVKKLQPGKNKKRMIWKELKCYKNSMMTKRKTLIEMLENTRRFKPNKDVKEPKKKIVSEETLLQESFKKLKAVEVLGSESTHETSSNDLKEMSEEDVQNMLEIVPVSEFKVEALQNLVKEKFSTVVPSVDKEKALWVKLERLFELDADDVLWKLQRYMHYLITWKLHTNYGVHQVSSTTRRHDMFMLTEKDDPLSITVMTLMLSAKLQVEEDNEMARDLVMKICIEANKPKSRSLDTSSK
nr:putative ribonuclease H-like domain-containing protein [Tanacetum cinerariifolium]